MSYTMYSNKKIIDFFLVIELIYAKSETNNLDKVSSNITNKSKTNKQNINIVTPSNMNKNLLLINNPKIKEYSKFKKKVIFQIPENNEKLYGYDPENILNFFPYDGIYEKKEKSTFFTLLFCNMNHDYYYAHVLRVYELTKIFISDDKEVEAYVPKYLCFTSRNYFCISFKHLLEEIYINSTISIDNKCYKIEHILNYIIYRMYLPKSVYTQLSFPLGKKNYLFYNNEFKSELSIKLLFYIFTYNEIIYILISLITEAKIILIHENM